ncbi:hypothetical protein V8J88_22400 [Massilia sp. W12]|uniref:hypothetical protein n=1 Tax=Massilia sp. W12 TaxID=3126507 RepID=UPI0030D4A270
MAEDTAQAADDSAAYARCVENSRHRQWDLERDVIRGRTLSSDMRFLPDGISRVGALDFLTESEKIRLSQVQGRTYAHMFGMFERFIGIKALELCRRYALSDQIALQALICFVDEELKHQEMFARIEQMATQVMPPGYRFVLPVVDVALSMLGKSTWAVLALACQLELFTQAHYRESVESGQQICPLYKDVFLYHWRDEMQHALIDELEWQRENSRLSAAQREQAVDDLIYLMHVVNDLVQLQTQADVDFFIRISERHFDQKEINALQNCVLKAYRWQYIVAGVQDIHFSQVLGRMVTVEHAARIQQALCRFDCA